MSDTHVRVENFPDLVRDTNSHAIINTNRSAYEQAKRDLLILVIRIINNLKIVHH